VSTQGACATFSSSSQEPNFQILVTVTTPSSSTPRLLQRQVLYLYNDKGGRTLRLEMTTGAETLKLVCYRNNFSLSVIRLISIGIESSLFPQVEVRSSTFSQQFVQYDLQWSHTGTVGRGISRPSIYIGSKVDGYGRPKSDSLETLLITPGGGRTSSSPPPSCE